MLRLFFLIFLITQSAYSKTYDYTGRVGLGAGLGYNWPIFDTKFNDKVDEHSHYDFHGRYHFNSTWSGELGWANYDFLKTTQSLRAIDLTGLYRFRSERKFSPVLGLGLGAAELTKDDRSSFNPSLKLRFGFDYSFTHSLMGSVIIDYLHVDKSFNKQNLPLGNIDLIAPRFQLTWYFGEEKQEEAKPVTAAPAPKKLVVQNLDIDGDGVLNKNDKCPHTPKGVKVNAYGCTAEEKATVRININFRSGKSIIEPQYNDELKKLATFMEENPKVKIEIQGHTDNTGLKLTNKKISEDRANAVRNYLIKYLKVNSTRLSARGYGEEMPVRENTTALGRVENRRVVAVISE